MKSATTLNALPWRMAHAAGEYESADLKETVNGVALTLRVPEGRRFDSLA